MKPDPRLRAALEPVWNEVREQRLLGRIVEARRQTEHAAGAGRCCRRAGSPWPPPLASCCSRSRHAQGARTVAARPCGGPASRLTLADGSEATLTADGNVQIEEQSPARVRLRQRTGGARYVVAHNPAREFVVATAGVTIRVRGTIFSVSDPPERRRDRSRARPRRDRRPAPDARSGGGRIAQRLRAGERSGHRGAARCAGAASRQAAAATPVRGARPSASELLARADAARADGRPADATRALEAFVADYPHERRVPATLFTLGRVENARGRAEGGGRRVRALRAGTPRWTAGRRRTGGGRAVVARCGCGRAFPGRRPRLPRRAPRGLHAAAMRELARR